MACYNRATLTERCLLSLEKFFGEFIAIHVFLVDAGSTDGTADLVSSSSLSIHLIQVDESFLWSRSMFVGQEVILNEYRDDFDYILWLNDDVQLYEDPPIEWVEVSKRYENAILVGQLAGVDSRTMSYGGFLKKRIHPISFTPIFYRDEFGPVDTFAGNFVLIPINVALNPNLRIILGLYDHLYADIDYGVTAKALNFPVIALPGFVGQCVNDHPYAIKDTVAERLAEFKDPKSISFWAQKTFLRRHAKFSWPFFILLPIVRALLGIPESRKNLHEK